MNLRDKIKKILRLLEEAYGRRAPFAKDDSVDVLIRTVLSQNTTDKNSLAAFARLKAALRKTLSEAAVNYPGLAGSNEFDVDTETALRTCWSVAFTFSWACACSSLAWRTVASSAPPW